LGKHTKEKNTSSNYYLLSTQHTIDKQFDKK
jgi:hypothetical protein